MEDISLDDDVLCLEVERIETEYVFVYRNFQPILCSF